MLGRLALCLLGAVGTRAVLYGPTRDVFSMRAGESYCVYMNSVTSSNTIFGVDLYNALPPFRRLKVSESECKEHREQQVLGYMLLGEEMVRSPFVWKFDPEELPQGTTSRCMPAGDPEAEHRGIVEFTGSDLQQLGRKVRDRSRLRLMYNGLSVISPSDVDATVSHRRGVLLGKLGGKANTVLTVYNHLHFKVTYVAQNVTDPGYFIFQTEVVPSSYRPATKLDKVEKGNCAHDLETEPLTFRLDTVKSDSKYSFQYSYTVEFIRDTKEGHELYSSRWDELTKLTEEGQELGEALSLRSVTYSLILIAVMTLFVSAIIMRTLHLDFNRYNNPDNEEEMQEEVGWKLVHTDVFRPPHHPGRLAVAVGTGAQLCGLLLAILFSAARGALEHKNHGDRVAVLLFVFCILAVLNGYVCGRILKMFDCKKWKTVFASALVYPGIVFVIWGFAEVLLKSRVGAVRVTAAMWFVLLLVWWVFAVPMAVLGASWAFKREAIKPPIPYRKVERQIPPQSWVFSNTACIMLPAVVPCVAMLSEFTLISQALWQGRVHILFGYLILIGLGVLVITVQCTIAYIYYQLVYEDYRWWWKSFLSASGLGVYYFLYSLWYLVSKVTLTPLAVWIYFSINMVIGLTLALALGSMGFMATWVFVNTIYKAIKIE